MHLSASLYSAQCTWGGVGEERRRGGEKKGEEEGRNEGGEESIRD